MWDHGYAMHHRLLTAARIIGNAVSNLLPFVLHFLLVRARYLVGNELLYVLNRVIRFCCYRSVMQD